MLPVDAFSNTKLITISMFINNLGYLEDKSLHFMKILNSGLEKINKMLVGLDKTAIIPKINKKDLLYLIVLEAEYANKKKEKDKR